MLQIVKDVFSLLTFQLTRDEFLRFDRKHLIFGIISTWIVGIGRYWDHPNAELLQYLGVGSVVYIFALSLLIWLIIRPFRNHQTSYFQVLTFISLVSPPAIFYAIPVERVYTLEVANTINVLFLLVVALWRVALLLYFLRKIVKLGFLQLITATFLPITFIVFTLTVLNLEKAVFDVMGGIRKHTPNDDAYTILNAITFLSMLGFPFFLLIYIILYFTDKSDD